MFWVVTIRKAVKIPLSIRSIFYSWRITLWKYRFFVIGQKALCFFKGLVSLKMNLIESWRANIMTNHLQKWILNSILAHTSDTRIYAYNRSFTLLIYCNICFDLSVLVACQLSWIDIQNEKWLVKRLTGTQRETIRTQYWYSQVVRRKMYFESIMGILIRVKNDASGPGRRLQMK
jgi:hypothetical protein